MDDEKLEKTIEFILNNQAQFTVDIQLLQEANKDAEKRLSVLERATVNLYNSLTETSKNVSAVADKVDLLSDKVDKLADSQKETDERLNAVIMMAERFFSGENGDSEKKK
jgi:chromosome segregation ATPase